MIDYSLRRSFAGGEITPELAGRLDLVKNQTGVAEATNFMVLPHGPLTRRAGTEMCTEISNSEYPARVVSFAFSADQTAALEFGHLTLRIIIDGAVVVEPTLTITGVTKANPGVVTYTGTDPTNGRMVFFAGLGGMTELNGRYGKIANVNAGANTFEIDDPAGNPLDTTGFTTYTSGGQAGVAYEVTTPYDSSDLLDLHITQSADVVTITHPSYPAKELRRLSETSWTLTDVSFSAGLSAPAAPSVVATVPTATNLSPCVYCVTAVAADGVTESLASNSTSVNNNLSLAGNYNTISWLTVSGASRYYIYRKKGGGYGYIGQTTGLSMVDDNIAPDTSQSPPENIITLNTGADDYPTAVAHHEQRRWFGGTVNEPQVMWATRTGTESNLTSSIPSRAADAMELRAAAMQNNRIRHLVPLNDLIALTAGGVFRIFSDGAAAITPDTVSIKAQGNAGASMTQPVTTADSIMYVQKHGARLREIRYATNDSSGNTTFTTLDVTLMAPHRFNGYRIVDLAYSQTPDQVVWAVRSDGVLCGLTHVPEQQVYGWHFHETDGIYESCCVIAEGDADVLYVVVKRTIDGRDVRFIERLRTRLFTTQDEAFFVDCGKTWYGSAATEIGGLHHLEGETVSILADGAVVPDQVVVDGKITLDTAATPVHIGLPYSSRLKTLPLSVESVPAGGQGRQKNVNAVAVRVSQSSLVKAGPSFDKLTAYPARAVSDDLGSPPALRSGEFRLNVTPSWGPDGAVCIEQSAPLPLTVLSIALETAVGG